jgi:hypothetical protein
VSDVSGLPRTADIMLHRGEGREAPILLKNPLRLTRFADSLSSG